MRVRAAALAALAAAATACYGPGERNQGAPGFPAVEYRECCDGQASVEKAGDWGRFCPGGGGGGAADCYAAGERNQGAAGFPAVEYKPCCDGQASVEVAGDWGRFCPGGGGGGGGGGGNADCYAGGERNQGAAGFPAVEYKPCCDGQASVEVAGDWGRFCPGGGGGNVVDEVPYNPILCGGVGECGCSGAGAARCSVCPDDGGSENVNDPVCWCEGVPGVSTGNECNPLKPNGPVSAGEGVNGGGGGADGCYGPGERNQGAAGFPGVEYKPCCDGQAAVERAGDWGKFCPGALVDPQGPVTGGGNGAEYYLSDVPLYVQQSGFGPVERDMSAGEAAPGDGVPMSIAGRAFGKGLGVHSTSVVSVALQGQCSAFRASVGVDDETRGPLAIPGGPYGSVQFEVLVDGASRWKSGVIFGGQDAVDVPEVDLSGAQELLLIVSDGGDDFTKDHANWADARVECTGPPNGDTSKLKATRGEWGPTLQWPVKAIHASLIPGNGGKGVIVSHASKKIGEIGDNDVDFPHDMTKVDSANVGTWDHQWVDRQGVEMYCSGHVVQNGGVLEFGGHGGQIDWVYLGKTQTSRYDPGAGWTVLQDMVQPRWYPTALTLGNGEILSIAGSNGDEKGNIYKPEVFNPTTGTWRTLWNVDYQGLLVTQDKEIILDDTYPFTVLASDGRVLWFGWDESMAFISTAGNGAWEDRGQRENFKRAWASPLLIRVDQALLVGGLDPALKDGKAVSSVVKMDFPGGSTPQVSYVQPMIFPRVDTQATILPDGTAFINGGGNEHRLGGSPMHIYPGEIYNPDTGGWTVTAAAANPRGYHSTALLLPDGRVWTAGGECSTEANGADNCPSGKTAEVYSPPYLFDNDGNLRGRPSIDFVDEAGSRGTMTMTSNSFVARVTLVRVGSATHHMNFDQRFLELGFTPQGGGQYELQVPQNTNELPPGHYLMSIIDNNGTPSESKFVQFF